MGMLVARLEKEVVPRPLIVALRYRVWACAWPRDYDGPAATVSELPVAQRVGT